MGAFHFSPRPNRASEIGWRDWGPEAFQEAKAQDKPLNEVYKLRLSKIREFIPLQVKLRIPIFTYYLFSDEVKRREMDFFHLYADSLSEFFENLADDEMIHKNKIKISVLGKWYNLPGRLVEAIKKVIEDTKEYDGFFMNFCINYEGQEEIVDACRLIALKVKAGKLDPEAISKDDIKENIYSSYFLPPDIIIINDNEPLLSGFLLWDSVDSYIYNTQKYWPDFTEADLLRIVGDYERIKSNI